MKKLAKAITVITVSLFGFVILALVYSSTRGYVAWFVKIRHPVITVNGKNSKGWLHRARDGNVMFFTERGSGSAVTYDLVFADNSNGYVFSCGAWVAPRWPVIPLRDVSPPCFFQGSAGQGLTRGPNSVSFSTLDGRKLGAHW